MKLPGLLALGRTFAKAPEHAPVLLDAALPGLRPERPARALRPARVADSPTLSAAGGSASRPIPAMQFPGAARAAGKTVGNGTAASVAAPSSSGPASSRRERGGWWRRRRQPPQSRELRLAAVRVVRNDLFADDLELIPQPSPAARGLKLGVERAVPSGGWRGWLAHWAHLLGLRRERHP